MFLRESCPIPESGGFASTLLDVRQRRGWGNRFSLYQGERLVELAFVLVWL